MEVQETGMSTKHGTLCLLFMRIYNLINSALKSIAITKKNYGINSFPALSIRTHVAIKLQVKKIICVSSQAQTNKTKQNKKKRKKALKKRNEELKHL